MTGAGRRLSLSGLFPASHSTSPYSADCCPCLQVHSISPMLAGLARITEVCRRRPHPDRMNLHWMMMILDGTSVRLHASRATLRTSSSRYPVPYHPLLAPLIMSTHSLLTLDLLGRNAPINVYDATSEWFTAFASKRHQCNPPHLSTGSSRSLGISAHL
ncbi:uncharacterized protein EDB91DRAFT_151589 [Suillus paluster]|uniref:uncharacterized protein n=1 Tax=Suillus paluster TaxID=48578 RepID=UPI001B8741C6|nr:uncharacterized protein EDB91DRAFT_151589 [Suillus paluster]KAG1745497.1 hypothetical protein EDB91DRAFT_151589 [Suillus paluster]